MCGNCTPKCMDPATPIVGSTFEMLHVRLYVCVHAHPDFFHAHPHYFCLGAYCFLHSIIREDTRLCPGCCAVCPSDLVSLTGYRWKYSSTAASAGRNLRSNVLLSMAAVASPVPFLQCYASCGNAFSKRKLEYCVIQRVSRLCRT